MVKQCQHPQTKVSMKTGKKPKHVCLLCGLVLNSKETRPKKKDVSNPKEKKV